ncbi:MAG: efflux RND transporter periplasmic adaptor subunit [Prevotellaceae bacterium]|jgi:RND family efflux transporter MFP subunit|nr:efflux RND transporter periplasmic adaptor subunit [Prevotellaceae bacterium]
MKLYLYILYLLFAGVLIAGCRPSHAGGEGQYAHEEENEQPGVIAFTAAQAQAAGLQTVQMAAGTFSRVIKTGGQVQPAQGDEVTVAATAEGILTLIHPSMSDGASVRAGEALAAVSAKNLPEGDPAAKTKVAYETALKDYRRAEELVKDTIISAKEFEQARLRYETAKTAYQAQADNYTPGGVKIASPVTGFVKKRWAEEGDYVTVGQPVAVISQNKRLQLRAEAPERYFQALRSIHSAHFKTAYSDTLYKLPALRGQLRSFGKASGLYIPVVFEFDNPGDLLPGAFAEVYLLGAPQENVMAVPITALTEEQGYYFVYLQLSGETYRKQAVTLGASNGEKVQVLSGLNPGDVVVTRGAYQVKLAAATPQLPAGHSH